MKIIEGNANSFKSEVLESKTPVLVDFNATWCGPCRMLGPILEEIAEENDSFKIVSVDVDENDDLAGEYGVSSIPCLVLFKDGKESSRSVGFIGKEDVLDFIGDK